MPQQVNLCLPILRKQEKRFAAQSLAQALAVVLLVGGGLAAVWIWSLNTTSASLQATLASQSKELEDLRATLERANASAGASESPLVQELRQRKLELQQRQSVLEALSQGLFAPGQGHSARLRLVAQTIPAVAWLTQVKADDQLLDLSGYTLEPAALNEWVSKLAASPLLQGQSLNTVKVEGVKPANTLVQATSVSTAPHASGRANASDEKPAMWSFSLLSKVATAPSSSGVKP
ncbi:PilN domain-containing protein [Rhodoferax sp.]|uniref:PilN domain-containing protein n=1 Tax=Rhodoferax sp. TaxID=50421 RepID=UPI0028508F2A|nr:PilN domain-containing protein [Rhodoferax sp.]MDR3370376.1 PilN domain-containing protein [Rhodoferax sp.]